MCHHFRYLLLIILDPPLFNEMFFTLVSKSFKLNELACSMFVCSRFECSGQQWIARYSYTSVICMCILKANIHVPKRLFAVCFGTVFSILFAVFLLISTCV